MNESTNEWMNEYTHMDCSVHNSNCFWKSWMPCAPKEDRDHPHCHQDKVQKPAVVIVWGCVSALHMVKCTFVKAPIMLKGAYRFLRNMGCQHDNVKTHRADVTTVWLHIKRAVVVDWSACSSEVQNMSTLDYWATEDISRRNRKNFTFKTSTVTIPISQMLSDC